MMKGKRQIEHYINAPQHIIDPRLLLVKAPPMCLTTAVTPSQGGYGLPCTKYTYGIW